MDTCNIRMEREIMETMKQTTDKFVSNMRLVVIENHLSELMYLIDGNDIHTLVGHTHEFALNDVCSIETTNPVIYAVAMKHFVGALFWEYEAQEREHSFDVYLHKFMTQAWFEFVDTFVEFTRVNLDTIISDAEEEE